MLQIVKHKSDSVLGFEWTFTDEFIVISNSGIELYQVDAHSASRPTFTSARFITIHSNWYIYWPETKLLFISSGTANLFIYKLKPRSVVEVFPTLSIHIHSAAAGGPSTNPLVRARELLSIQITRRNVLTFSMYSHRFIGILFTWTESPRLCLYRLSSKNSYRKDLEMDLLEKGDFLFNVIDGLLVCNNMTTCKSLVFDIKSPTPSKPLFSSSFADLFDTVKEMQQFDVAHQDKNVEDVCLWRSIQPNAILSDQLGFFATVSFNMSRVLECLECSDRFTPITLTEFLIRRRDESCFSLRTKPLSAAMSRGGNCADIRGILELLMKNYDAEMAFSPTATSFHNSSTSKSTSLSKALSMASLASGFSSAAASALLKRSGSGLPKETTLLDPETTSFQVMMLDSPCLLYSIAL